MACVLLAPSGKMPSPIRQVLLSDPRYPEAGLVSFKGVVGGWQDVTVQGHSQIWGSWFTEDKSSSDDVKGVSLSSGWGFACCQLTDASARCPYGPEAMPKMLSLRPEEEAKPQKRRKGQADEPWGES